MDIEHKRLTPAELHQITGYVRPTAQIRWFEKYMGVLLPYDTIGPIINVRVLHSLMARATGLPVKAEDPLPIPRPRINPKRGPRNRPSD